MAIKTYDPQAVSFVLNGQEAYGFAEGDMISVEKNEPYFNVHVGAKGETSRAAIRDNNYTITARFQHTSPFIETLEAFKVANNISKLPPVIGISIFDPSSNDGIVAGEGWLMEDPSRSWGTEVGVREYIFFVVNGITKSAVIGAPIDSFGGAGNTA